MKSKILLVELVDHFTRISNNTMSSNANRTSENDDDDIFNGLCDLNSVMTYLHNDFELEEEDMPDEILHNIKPADENNKTLLPIETNLVEQIVQQTVVDEIFTNYFYDMNDSNSNLDYFQTETILDTDSTCYNGSCCSNNNCPSPVSVINVANASDSQCNATMQLAIDNHASESNHATTNNNADAYEINKAAAIILPTLPESPFERKTKRKYRCTESYSAGKKCKTCKSINSRYPDGDEIKEAIITEEDIIKFNEFKNKPVKCCKCKNIVSFSKVFLYRKRYVCEDCAKEERIDLVDLKNDLYELLDYTGEKLYKCKRLEHARPLYQFIKYSERTKKFRVVTNCCYCRLYKAQENVFKKD